MNERNSFHPEGGVRGRAGLDSYAKGENPATQTNLRLASLEGQLSVMMFGKAALDLGEGERRAIESAKALMTDAEKLRFPQMTKVELAELARNLHERSAA